MAMLTFLAPSLQLPSLTSLLAAEKPHQNKTHRHDVTVCHAISPSSYLACLAPEWSSGRIKNRSGISLLSPSMV